MPAAPPADFERLQAEVGRRFDALSPQLQRIARFALERPQDVALDTVAAAASKAEVQPSAMVRFAQALGYGGYTDMQRIFRDRLVERSSSYRDRIATLRRASPARARPKTVLRDFVADSIANLSHLEEHVAPERLEHAVRLLSGASRIHLLAQRRAFPVACYLAYALNQLELRAHLLDGLGGMLDEFSRGIGRGDVLLVASFRNYTPAVVDTALAARARGVAVVAITDSALSPLKPAADVCFELGDDSSRPFRSLVAPLCLAQALVVGTGQALAAPTRREKHSARRGAGRQDRP